MNKHCKMMTSGYLAISVKQSGYIVSLENSNYKYPYIGPPGYSQIQKQTNTQTGKHTSKK